MNSNPKEKDWQRLVLLIMSLASIGCVVGYILYCTDFYFNSDYAAYVLLAREQIRTGQFFPDGFCYSTGVFIFTPELFIVPLMSFVSDWVLCRALAVICWNFLLLVCIFFLFRMKGMSQQKMRYAPFILVLMLCLPTEHYVENFFEGAYVSLLMYELLIIFFLNKLINSGKELKKRYFVCFTAAVYISNITGIRNIAIMVFPLIAALAINLYLEHRKRLEDIWKEKKIFFIAALSGVGGAAGYATFCILVRKLGLLFSSAGMEFVTREKVLDNFHDLLLNILEFHKTIIAGDLISVGGVTAVINFVFMVVTVLVIPLHYLIKIKKIQNRFWRIYVLYAWISNFVVLYMMVFTSASAIRYLHTVYFHNIMFLALFLEEMFAKKEKIMHIFWILALSGVIGAGHLNYYVNTVKPIRACYEAEKGQERIYEFLEENDLTYGFSSFWNAYENMVRSKNQVTILAWGSSPQEPFYWLTQREWYDVEQHPGKCFLLLEKDEEVAGEYLELASERLEFQNYTILVYEKNIFLYEELNELYRSSAN